MLILASEDLAELAAHQLRRMSENPKSGHLLGQLWEAVKVSDDARDFLERNELSFFASRGRGAFKLAGDVAADTVSDSQFGSLFSEYASRLGFTEEEREASSPRDEIGKVSAAAGSFV